MASTYTPKLHAVKVGSTYIPGITKGTIPQNNTINSTPTGSAHVEHAALAQRLYQCDFSTHALNAAINACGLYGQLLSAGTLTLYTIGGDETNTTGSSYAMASGLMFANQISCDGAGDAEISYTALPIGSPPVVPLHGISAPSVTKTEERFGMGSVTINGVKTGKQNVTISFGVRAEQVPVDGSVDAEQYLAITEIKTVVTVRGISMDWITTAGLGDGTSETNATIVFRKRENGGQFLGSGDVTFTAARGIAAATQLFDASGRSHGTAAFEMTCIYDGTHMPLVKS